MSPHESAHGVVLVPAASAAREQLACAAARAGLRVVETPEEAIIGLVDLTLPEGSSALSALLATPAGAGLSLVALVEPGEASFAILESLRPAEVMTAGGQLHELAWRLWRVADRHRERLELMRRQQDLSLLVELTADYAESLDVEALLHDVTRRLAARLGIGRAALVMLDRNGDGARMVAASDAPGQEDVRIDLERYPEVREAARTGQPVIVEDASHHPLLEGVQDEVAARGIHTLAALPLHIRGEVRGVLLLRASGGERRTFARHEIEFLNTVAHATAVALRNASLLQSVRGQTEREMTARIAAEAKAASLETYHLFFANVREGVAILDDRAAVLSLNPAGESILEMTSESAYGLHLVDVTQPLDETVLMELVTAARRGESRSDVDMMVRTPGGKRLTLSFSAAPLEDGRRAIILSFRDVTQARQLADELRHTKDFLERLIDSSVDAIVAADMQGRVILFNKGAEALFGYTALQALGGMHVNQLYPAGVAQRIMTLLRSPEHGGRGRLSVCRQDVVNRTGQLVPVNMTASIVYEGGREVASVGIFTDLRDRMELERKLSDVENRLEESEKNAVIVALAGTAAHELNQPLTSVMGYAELLKRRLKEEDSSYKPVDIIYREAERMAEIVRKIGRITRYETKAYMGSQQILDLDKASSHDD
ncbi:PAS domain S-box protein [Vitiosangium sp. GDMCC 1.1324]|uniref:PAS domain S-box protein n=1 Tax=Vitiosangium sp. (strain GDMCC 1.1324) TaxID=2138576 RepID=UPI000D33A8B3|nr:PAS domain S-box protein [Vitiosangium sp. GDMCC 1.1324]PTL83080.1 histidine kinase [Vitiosangium sp. GDMCC 1.1324]